MKKAVNDATLNKAGDIYQYLIALRDCFELCDDDTLQIETNGDVSIINNNGGLFQKEVKHHFGNTFLSDRDVDFWKTLAAFLRCRFNHKSLVIRKVISVFEMTFH